jgi:DNA-binding CsgD family transcriptional regulator
MGKGELAASIALESAIESLARALEELYVPVNPEDFPSRIFDVFGKLFPGTKVTLDSANLKNGALKYQRSFEVPCPELWSPETSHLIKPGHPAVRLITDGARDRTFRISDLEQASILRKTFMFNEAWRPSDIRFQMLALFDVPDHKLGITLNRDRDFSDHELRLLDLMVPHVDRALYYTRTIQALGGRVATTDLRRLTKREREVFHWMSQGKRDKEIATILKISPRTVSKHIQNILEKLGAENRGSAATLGLV